MSMVCPGLANGGSSAWMDTAATFFSWMLPPLGTLMPNCASMLLKVCTVNGVCGLVAAAIEAHHQPVTDQLVGAHAVDGRHVLSRSARVVAQTNSKPVSRSIFFSMPSAPVRTATGAHEEAVQPAGLAGVGEGAGTRIVMRASAMRVDDTVLSVAISSWRTRPAMRTSSSPVLSVIHFAAYGEDAVGQHFGNGHGDRAGQAVALPRLARAGGVARGVVFGAEAHRVAGQRVGMDTAPPNSEPRPILALLSLEMLELAFLLAWVRSARVMVMMSPTR